MKRFWTIFSFEFISYMKNKAYLLTTFALAVVLGVVMFIPSFVDLSKLDEETEGDEQELVKYGVVDDSGYYTDLSMFESVFEGSDFCVYDKEAELKSAVENEDLDAGFYIEDLQNYKYFVKNTDWADENQYILEQVMTEVYRQITLTGQGMDYETISSVYAEEVKGDVEVLGKDMENNYWYCYMLTILVFVMVMYYGAMIATSIAKEKSNRSIEMLVTSVNSTYLLFGKVLAAVCAVFVQVVAILGVTLACYGINREAWDYKLDMLLHIPTPVLLAFAVFGIGGFLFYAFCFGALGALVSRTEDINSSTGALNMILMVVYFAVLMQLTNVDGIVIRVCSFLPISSYSAMFVRIGMGEVATWEVIVSAVILYASVIGAGWIGAKIYRLGTLRYGNPIKLSKAIGELRKK